MIWQDINKIPYPFLYNAVLSISKEYTVQNVRMDFCGEVFVKVVGRLKEKDRNSIMDELVKGKNIKPDYHNDWDYSEDGDYTYIYSPDGLDYRTMIDILEEKQYYSIEDIPYTFLRKALLKLIENYVITSVTISEEDGLILDIMGVPSEEQIRGICRSLCPKNVNFDWVFGNINSMYSNFKETNVDYTSIVIPKSINYTTL